MPTERIAPTLCPPPIWAACALTALLLVACTPDALAPAKPAASAGASAASASASGAAAVPTGSLSGAGGAACDLPDSFIHPSRDGNRTVLAGPGVLAFRAPYAVNTDGAPNSYHPADPWGTEGLAINTICNGVSAVTAAGETVDYRQCRRLVDIFTAERDAGWPAGGDRIQFYGAVAEADSGAGAERPCLQPDGAMVSSTSLLADPARGRCDPARYLDAQSVPFLIVPGHSGLSARGMSLGDLAVVVNPATGRTVYAVVGDGGPKTGLGEGSVALDAALLGRTDRPTTLRQSYGFAVPDAFTFVMTGTRAQAPYTAESLARQGQAALEALGGEARVAACLAALPG